MLLHHAKSHVLLSCFAFACITEYSSVATAASEAPQQAVSYLDGTRRITALRRGSATIGHHGQKLWPVQIVSGKSTIDSFVDHKAIVRIDPNKKSDLEQAHLRIVEALMPSIGIYSVESLDAEDGLDIAARLANPNTRPHSIREAIPNLYLRLERHGEPFIPNDPRFSGQWYFDDKRLQMPEVWGITQGDPKTTIVVIDTGCDMTHPDLIDKLDPGLDVIDDDDDASYDPALADAAHGTACAGLVGASTNNGVGMAGACPLCRIRCVRMLSDAALSIDAHVKAFNFAFDTGAAVVSNSWGFADPIPVPTLLRDAIDNLFDNGRGGKGTLVFFAAGNDDREVGSEELVGVRGATAIGATNQFFDKTAYTNYGAPLDIVAPVGTLTTDIVGNLGYDPTEYTTTYSGTSSACPVAAGAAGLVASAIPDKTSAEVLDLLIRTARPAPYASPDENGHDPVFGYGIINPLAALKDALGIVDGPADAGPDASSNTNTYETDASCACRAGARSSIPQGWTVGLYAFLSALFITRRRTRR